jgi:AraC family transcriptional activator of pyochelin receptor
MDLTEATFSRTSTVRIDGHAAIEAVHCTVKHTHTVQADSLDILLFCLKEGQLTLQASFIPHPIELSSQEAMFLANPRDVWSANLVGEAGTQYHVVRMTLSAMHQLINPGFDTKQLEGGHKVNMRDLMRILSLTPSVSMAFDQLMHHRVRPPFRSLYEKGKFLEIFSLVMESAFGQPVELCPVALSPSIENKLQLVRRHIIEHPDETPDPDVLARLYELPRNTLREGYRFKFGKTIHQFHADHRLDYAMQMLSEGEMLVKEVAFKIGYQNPSHFIAAFKKKFGYTPKQYLKLEA